MQMLSSIIIIFVMHLVVMSEAGGGGGGGGDVKRALLMLEDSDILYTAGTQRVLEPLKRTTPGVPDIKPDREWEGAREQRSQLITL